MVSGGGTPLEEGADAGGSAFDDGGDFPRVPGFLFSAALNLAREMFLDQKWNFPVKALERVDVVRWLTHNPTPSAKENPPFDWGDRTAWRLFNAATHVLAGRVAENPVITRQLHQIIDGVCQHVN